MDTKHLIGIVNKYDYYHQIQVHSNDHERMISFGHAKNHNNKKYDIRINVYLNTTTIAIFKNKSQHFLRNQSYNQFEKILKDNQYNNEGK